MLVGCSMLRSYTRPRLIPKARVPLAQGFKLEPDLCHRGPSKTDPENQGFLKSILGLLRAIQGY